MTATVEGTEGVVARGRLRRAAPFLALAAAFVVLGLVSSPSGSGGVLDPDGTSPQGAKALVLVLRQYGAHVELVDGVPAGDVGAAVVLSDQLDDARRAGVMAWVRTGGRLVVADPRSPLQLGAATLARNSLTTSDLHPEGRCALLEGSGITRLSVGPSALLRTDDPRTQACFGFALAGAQEASFLLSTQTGRGLVVALGGAGLWTNQRLDADDNAALAVRLLAGPSAALAASPPSVGSPASGASPASGGSPASGASGSTPSSGSGALGPTRVAVLVASKVGSGHRSAFGLVSPRVKTGLLQLVVAFGALAWWRGRRLGRPVSESRPVRIAGSEIVVAVGDLLARTASRDAAAHQLRDGTRRALAERLGLGPHATPDQVADVACARTGADRSVTLGLLVDRPVPDDAGLAGLARSLVQLRQEVIDGPAR